MYAIAHMLHALAKHPNYVPLSNLLLPALLLPLQDVLPTPGPHPALSPLHRRRGPGVYYDILDDESCAGG